jgi:hypothetical protein
MPFLNTVPRIAVCSHLRLIFVVVVLKVERVMEQLKSLGDLAIKVTHAFSELPLISIDSPYDLIKPVLRWGNPCR